MEILDLLKVIFLGIVEGITEWLPISSTGHMLLVDEFLKVNAFSDESFKDLFIVVIQLGAILAVVLMFWNRIWPFGKKEGGGIEVKTPQIILWLKIAVACIPVGIIGLFFEDKVDEYFYSNGREIPTIATTLILYGIFFILLEIWNKRRTPKVNALSEMTFFLAFLIGCFQCLALIPGTSRSGATILGAMILGASRTMAAEFTFFLAIPTMAGASLLKILKYGFQFSGQQYALLLAGMLVAFLVSFLCIKLLMQYISKHDFKVFGWYRIMLGAIVMIYFITR